MKREIKFKRVFQHDETGMICMTTWGNIDHKDNVCDDFGSFKSPSQISGYYPITDLQFTGLPDRNNVEIYEGDILKTDVRAGNMKVIYFDTYASFMLEYKGLLYPLNEGADIEVIGNIYENPELL